MIQVGFLITVVPVSVADLSAVCRATQSPTPTLVRTATAPPRGDQCLTSRSIAPDRRRPVRRPCAGRCAGRGTAPRSTSTEADGAAAAPGDDLDDLCASAARVRDAGLATRRPPGRGHLLAQGVHPADPAVPGPLPLLHVRRPTPGQLRATGRRCTSRPTRSSTSPGRAPRSAARRRCSPSATGPRTAGRRRGSGSTRTATTRTLAYVRAMAIRVLEETGLLPHLNPGVMSLGGAAAAQAGRAVDGDDARDHVDAAVRPSRARPHYGSPDKDPAVRLRVLEDAGRLAVPFTTGHPGRHRRDPRRAGRVALRAPRASPGSTAHVQEVIVQNFRAKPDTAMRHADDLGLRGVPRRDRRRPAACSGPKMRVQAPPNLSDPAECRAAAARRRRRLGRRLAAHPRPRQPRAPLAAARRAAPRSPPRPASTLRERLTVHPRVRAAAGEPWLDPRVLPHVARARRPGDGLAVEGACPAGPAVAGAGRSAWHASGRIDLHAAIDTDGPAPTTGAATSTPSTATGTSCASEVARRGRPRRCRPRWTPTCRPRCGAAERRPGRADRRGSALALMQRRRRRRSTRSARSPTTCAGTPSATTSPTSSTGTSTSPTSATPAAGSAPSPSGAPTPTPTPSRWTQVADRAEEAWAARRDRGLHAGRHRPRPARHGVLRPRRAR